MGYDELNGYDDDWFGEEEYYQSLEDEGLAYDDEDWPDCPYCVEECLVCDDEYDDELEESCE